MIQLNNISMQYGDRVLIKPVSITIGENERIGLVGRNGAGKSTLLRILSQQITPHEGQVSLPNEYSIGYLQQELPKSADRSVLDEVMTAFADFGKLERQCAEMQTEMESRTDYESESYLDLIDRFTRAQERLHRQGPGEIEKQVELVLKGLGFQREEFQKPVGTFSGGWRMRIELAKLLLQAPDLLLLDEPTNHLDIHSIIWLEGFLQKYPGSIVLVSHDTTFMDRLVTRVFEIELGSIHDYRAGYRKFLELKEDRIEKSIAAYENQQREIAQTKRNIERFRYKASKAKFAQTLIKKLEKTELIEIVQTDGSAMHFRFPESRRAGNVVVDLEGVSKSFGPKQVLDNVAFELNRGEKVAFIGKNGMGKTTLARIIAGDLEADAGEVNMGYNVELNYFAQLQSGTLDEDLTVFDTIDQAATGDMRTQVRNLLGAFLFSGEDVDKKVKVLSGGEKSRLALAKMLLQPSNFLLLDEPTNHLDVASKAILKEAVASFKGACLIVSHDRDFLDGLTARIIEFTENGLVEHLGDINYFLERKRLEDIRAFELEQKKESAAVKQETENASSGNDYKERKERAKKERQLRNRAEKLEKEVQKNESVKAGLVEKLQSSYDEAVAREFHELETKIETLTEQWMEAQEALEAFLKV